MGTNAKIFQNIAQRKSSKPSTKLSTNPHTLIVMVHEMATRPRTMTTDTTLSGEVAQAATRSNTARKDSVAWFIPSGNPPNQDGAGLSEGTKKKVSALDKKVAASEEKLKSLSDKLEAAYDEFGNDSEQVAKLNGLISKTNRTVASLKMKQYRARNNEL